MEIRLKCQPGQATAEFALECQQKVVDLLQAIADDLKPGAMTFAPQSMQWVDDGKDEIVIRVTEPQP